MTTQLPDPGQEWRVEETEGRPNRPQALLAGPGHQFILYTKEHAHQLAGLLNAQTAALAEAATLARRYDCGKTNLQKAAMVPCLNLPQSEECYACQIARARFERNSYCICSDDDELPTAPATYCPVHGNTYKYVLQEEARLVDVVRSRTAATERADAADARAERLQLALEQIAQLTEASASEAVAIARATLTASEADG